MASDRDLSTGAKCKYLAMDATFEVCSKTFGQLLTIHGFVSILLSMLYELRTLHYLSCRATHQLTKRRSQPINKLNRGESGW